jgi:lipoprotein-releasing system permease protein
MNLAFHIALRYFYSKKIRNVIHLISRISQLGILVGTFALIVVLSVFNGFEDVIVSLYNSFDSEIKINSVNSKYFTPDSIKLSELQRLEGIKAYTAVIEENALLKYKNNQTIAVLKGIDPNYIKNTGLDTMVRYGEPVLFDNNINYALVGTGIATKLDLNLDDFMNVLQVYFPKKGKSSAFYLNPEQAFNSKPINPGGVFSIQQDFDSKYVVVSLNFLREVVNEPIKVTSIEITLLPGTKIKDVKKNIEALYGSQFEVKDRLEQHKWLFKITRSEKLVVFLILSLILLIAAFNLIGSLLMLSLEKTKDMMVLKSMGAESKLIRNIFFIEGILLSLSAAIIGIGLGALVCWLQMKYGFVKINAGTTFVLNAYPVSFRFMDFVWVFIAALIVGLLSSWLPARTAYKELNVKDINQ